MDAIYRLSPAFKRLLHVTCRPHCLICHYPAQPSQLCVACGDWAIAQKLDPKCCCIKCGITLPEHDASASIGDFALHCGRCLTDAPAFTRCTAAVGYAEICAKLVNQLKHQRRLAATTPISQIMVDHLQTQYHRPSQMIDLLVPVPLHPHRLKQRGFNQALEIARPLSRELGISLSENACLRVRNTAPQQGLKVSIRKRNLKNAFVGLSDVRDQHVAIIDDVVTTGTTTNSVARALLDAGAKSCDVWCFARTPLPS